MTSIMDSYTVAQCMWAVASSQGNKNCRAAKLEIATHLTMIMSLSMTGVRCFRRGCWHIEVDNCRVAALEKLLHFLQKMLMGGGYNEICFHRSARGISDLVTCQVNANLASRKFSANVVRMFLHLS